MTQPNKQTLTTITNSAEQSVLIDMSRVKWAGACKINTDNPLPRLDYNDPDGVFIKFNDGDFQQLPGFTMDDIANAVVGDKELSGKIEWHDADGNIVSIGGDPIKADEAFVLGLVRMLKTPEAMGGISLAQAIANARALGAQDTFVGASPPSTDTNSFVLPTKHKLPNPLVFADIVGISYGNRGRRDGRPRIAVQVNGGQMQVLTDLTDEQAKDLYDAYNKWADANLIQK